jgi:small acid-soluble spore protein D (minor alpha/beta-type SASP)
MLQSYILHFWQSYDCDGTFRQKRKRGVKIMKNNNQINVPQAREAMDRFKMQAASEVGVNLTNGYNGHLTSREAGSVGGQMVKKMIEAYEQSMQ